VGEGFEPLGYGCIEVWVNLTVEIDSSTASVVVAKESVWRLVKRRVVFCSLRMRDDDVLHAKRMRERYRFVWLHRGW
jgi:hypothetical protein